MRMINTFAFDALGMIAVFIYPKFFKDYACEMKISLSLHICYSFLKLELQLELVFFCCSDLKLFSCNVNIFFSYL